MLEKLKSFFSNSPPQPAEGFKPLTPLEPTGTEPVSQPLTASDIGYAIGAAGGSVTQAAEFQYILSRVAPGRRPTADEIGKAVGMMGGSLSQAIIIDALLNKK